MEAANLNETISKIEGEIQGLCQLNLKKIEPQSQPESQLNVFTENINVILERMAELEATVEELEKAQQE